MKSLFEFFIGFRYLKSKKSQGFISFNTLLSIFIVFLGVFILIIVISVMNGFQAQIKDKILDVDSHITVMIYRGDDGIKDYDELSKKLSNIEGVISARPYFQGQALFRYWKDITPVIVRGIGRHKNFPSDIASFIDRAKKTIQKENNKTYNIKSWKKSFSEGKNEVFIGLEMANNYNIRIGDKIELIVPKGKYGLTQGVTPGRGEFSVIGFFKTGYYDFDTKMVIMSLKTAQDLYAIGDKAWGIGVKIKDIFEMNKYARKIGKIVGYEYQTMTAEERNQNLFYALKLEKLIMTIILFLVIVSAGFTIMGTLVMVVMEKRRAIGILKSMGAGPYSIMNIFILEGFFIGIIGTVAGVICGLATAINLEIIIKWLETKINVNMTGIYQIFKIGIWENISLVPKHVYYIDSIPAEVKPEFVVTIAVFAVFLSILSAIFPAWYASRLKPVETIRYE